MQWMTYNVKKIHYCPTLHELRMIWLLLLPDNICRVISTSNSNLQNNNINLLKGKKLHKTTMDKKLWAVMYSRLLSLNWTKVIVKLFGIGSDFETEDESWNYMWLKFHHHSKLSFHYWPSPAKKREMTSVSGTWSMLACCLFHSSITQVK